MTQRIVEMVHPLQVIRFGSYARGTPHPRSDFDFMVVVPDGSDRKRMRSELYHVLRPFVVNCDLAVTTPDEIARLGDLVGYAFRPAFLEGNVLYDARTGLRKRKTAARATWEVRSVAEEDRLRATRVWLHEADLDFRSAESLYRDSELAWRVCFHAQQAAEKTLKAVLMFLQIQYPFTQNLDEIRDAIPGGWEVKDEFPDLEWLSGWAIRGRYPGLGEAFPEEAADAREVARGIYQSVMGEIQARGFTPT